MAAVNGTTLYILAYYLISVFQQVAKIALSFRYQLRGSWDPSRIAYAMADDEWLAHGRAAIISVNGIAPFISLVIGFIAYQWYWRRARAKRGLFKLLLLWIAFHGANAFFGALLADTFTQSGFWYVPSWLFELGNIVNVILAFIAGLIQLALGYLAAVAFLQAHDSKTVMKYQRRKQMVMYTLVFPWIAGTLLIILAKVPYISIQEILRLLMMGLLITPTALGCLNELFESTVRKPLPTHYAWGLIGLTVVFAAAWYLALSPPIIFG
jgi:hypothetical protein